MAIITGYSSIKENVLKSDGRIVFQDPLLPLEEFSEQAFKHLGISYPKFYKMDRMSKLGVLGAEVLLQNKSIAGLPSSSVAVVLSNAHASLDTDRRYFDSIKSIPSPSLFVYTLSNIVTGEICIRHGFKGENAFFVTPAFEPATMAEYVGAVMEMPNTSACIAGWIDVLGEQHEVFLYLVEKSESSSSGSQWSHDAASIEKLYLS